MITLLSRSQDPQTSQTHGSHNRAVHLATAIFGGAGDSRKQRKQLPDEQPDYIVRGFVMFGGLEIEAAE